MRDIRLIYLRKGANERALACHAHVRDPRALDDAWMRMNSAIGSICRRNALATGMDGLRAHAQLL